MFDAAKVIGSLTGLMTNSVCLFFVTYLNFSYIIFENRPLRENRRMLLSPLRMESMQLCLLKSTTGRKNPTLKF